MKDFSKYYSGRAEASLLGYVDGSHTCFATLVA